MKKVVWLFLTATMIWGCSKKSPTSSPVVLTHSKFVMAELSFQRLGFPYPGLWGYTSERVSIYSDSPPAPSVCLSRMKLDTTWFTFSQKWSWPGGVQLSDSVPIRRFGTSCSLFVTTTIDTCSGGGVLLPGAYVIQIPLRGDTLPWGDARLAWTRSENATWYEVDLAFEGDSFSGSSDTLLILTDTTTVIPQSFFRKDSSAAWLTITATVYAHDGAVPGGGVNLFGTIKGVFFTTVGDTGNTRSFYMGAPKGIASPMSSLFLSEEKRNRLLQRVFRCP